MPCGDSHWARAMHATAVVAGRWVGQQVPPGDMHDTGTIQMGVWPFTYPCNAAGVRKRPPVRTQQHDNTHWHVHAHTPHMETCLHLSGVGLQQGGLCKLGHLVPLSGGPYTVTLPRRVWDQDLT